MWPSFSAINDMVQLFISLQESPEICEGVDDNSKYEVEDDDDDNEEEEDVVEDPDHEERVFAGRLT